MCTSLVTFGPASPPLGFCPTDTYAPVTRARKRPQLDCCGQRLGTPCVSIGVGRDCGALDRPLCSCKENVEVLCMRRCKKAPGFLSSEKASTSQRKRCMAE